MPCTPSFSRLFFTAIPESSDMQGTENPSAWFEEWFNHPFYLQLYSHRNRDEAERCIHTILSLTELDRKPCHSVSVLDIACGAGRHALEFARLGYPVTGNDLSPFLLEEARKEAASGCLNVQLTGCDMREIKEQERFDLVVQLFTSFGYFTAKEEDMLVLQRVYDALKSGGWYVLDLINPIHLERTLVPHSCRMAGDLTVNEKRSLENGRITKTITITSPAEERLNFTESVRVYAREEIASMLSETGFSLSTIAGDYEGFPFEATVSPRMMLFCRKP